MSEIGNINLKPREHFLLNIIPEIRTSIFKFSLPKGQNLVLDPDNLYHPGPVQAGDYQSTLALLLTCKQVYNEILPFVYSRNTITIAQPWNESINRFKKLPPAALPLIKKVEVHVQQGLEEMGPNSEYILTGRLPALRKLRINMWHGRFWLRTAMELAYNSWKSGGKYTLKMELYESIHDLGYLRPFSGDIIAEEMEHARDISRIYVTKMPDSIKTVTLSASVKKDDGYIFATYINEDSPSYSEKKVKWRFNKDGNKDKKAVKYLVWEGEKDGSA